MPSIPGTPVLGNLRHDASGTPSSFATPSNNNMDPDRIRRGMRYESSPYYNSGSSASTASSRNNISARRNGPARDRFVPSSINAMMFRMGNPVENMTTEERLTRRHVPGVRNRSTSPEQSHESAVRAFPRNVPNNSRLATGSVGVFGSGTTGVGVRADSSSPYRYRQRGIEVSGGIFSGIISPERENAHHAMRISAALGVDTNEKVFNCHDKNQRVSPMNIGHPIAGLITEADRLWTNAVMKLNGNQRLRHCSVAKC